MLADPASAPLTQYALMNRLFISQMLQFSGMFESRGAFGGGTGEDQFASFLREEYAGRLAERVQILPQQTLHSSSSR